MVSRRAHRILADMNNGIQVHSRFRLDYVKSADIDKGNRALVSHDAKKGAL